MDYAVLGPLGIVFAIVFGYIGYKKGLKKDSYNEGSADGEIKTDIQYIKRGIDDIKLEQGSHKRDFNILCERVTRIEESAKTAHKRIDKLYET